MKRWLYILLFVFFALVFLFSAYLLTDYLLESRKQQNEFSALTQIKEQSAQAAQVDPNSQPNASAQDDNDPAAQTTLVDVTNPETGETLQILPEFTELYKMNPHIVGWITIDGTAIDYPVMQTPNAPNYYLYKNYSQEYSRHGCIYVREVCDVFTPSDNLTIYGHRMGDGTMFNALHNYADKDFYEDHRYITFSTIFEHHTYEILSVFRISSTVGTPFPYHEFVEAADAEEFDKYIQNCNDYALYDTGVTASYGDKLITLSTCEYSQVNGRLVVVAKRID